jgi:hypothetical protein
MAVIGCDVVRGESSNRCLLLLCTVPQIRREMTSSLPPDTSNNPHRSVGRSTSAFFGGDVSPYVKSWNTEWRMRPTLHPGNQIRMIDQMQ